MGNEGKKGTPKVIRTRRRLYESVAAEAPAEKKAAPKAAKKTAARPAPEAAATAAFAPQSAAAQSFATREDRAMAVFMKHAPYIAGAVIVPLPLVETVWVAGVQLKMLKEISDIYGVPFQRNAGKAAIGALVGGHSAFSAAKVASELFMRSVPVLGYAARVISTAGLGLAVSYALCKVFVMHFESGGTFLTFDTAKMKEYFAIRYKEGSALAAAGHLM